MNRFHDWVAGLESRHLADLTFTEAARSLRALSATYVERRHRIGSGAALDGRGKRAAFALFYGPLHYLLIHEIVTSLPGATRPMRLLADLGCGTGAAGAAWAAAHATPPAVLGVDRHPWVVAEAGHTYRAFGLSARTTVGDLSTVDVPGTRVAFLAAFVLNELQEEGRERALARLLARSARGDCVLVVEPLAGFVAPWWKRWQTAVEAAGGRADEWRLRVELPDIVAKLDRAAGLRHQEITGRSFWIPGA